MPSGRAHHYTNFMAFVTIPAVILLAWISGPYFIGDWQSVVTLLGGALLSTMGVCPDQDINEINGKRIRLFHEQIFGWGPFLMYWSLPYGWTMDKFGGGHRGISHVHVLGTVTRVFIFGLWLIPLLPILVFGVHWKLVTFYSVWAFIGLALADSMHIISDMKHRTPRNPLRRFRILLRLSKSRNTTKRRRRKHSRTA